MAEAKEPTGDATLTASDSKYDTTGSGEPSGSESIAVGGAGAVEATAKSAGSAIDEAFDPASVQQMRVDLVIQLEAAVARACRAHLSLVSRSMLASGCTYSEAAVAVEPVVNRCRFRSLPSHWLQYLQRFQAHVVCEDDWEPTPVPPSTTDLDISTSSDGFGHVLDDPILDYALSAGLKLHLLSHATEGYFIPVELPAGPLYNSDGRIPGGWVGSSHALLQELIDLTPKLGIDLVPLKGRVRRGGGIDISEECVAQLNAEGPEDSKFHVERKMWFALYEAARLSIKHRSTIVLR